VYKKVNLALQVPRQDQSSMFKSSLLSSVLFALTVPLVSGKEVPVTLDIVNTVLGPDGFNRSQYLSDSWYAWVLVTDKTFS